MVINHQNLKAIKSTYKFDDQVKTFEELFKRKTTLGVLNPVGNSL